MSSVQVATRDWHCPRHKDQMIMACCVEHNELICNLCYEHDGCTHTTIMGMQHDVRKNCEAYIKTILQKKERREEVYREAGKHNEQTNAETKSLIASFERNLAEIKRTIEDRYIGLCNEINDALNKTDNYAKECDRNIEIIKSISKKASPMDVLEPEEFKSFCRCFDVLSRKLSEPIAILDKQMEQLKAQTREFLESTAAAEKSLGQMRDKMVFATKINNVGALLDQFKKLYKEIPQPVSWEKCFGIYRKMVAELKPGSQLEESDIKEAFDSASRHTSVPVTPELAFDAIRKALMRLQTPPRQKEERRIPKPKTSPRTETKA